MEDKAVATDEVCYANTCIEVARLEAVLNSLVEHKVEAIKNDRTSAHSSPRALIKRLRLTSSSTVSSSKDKEKPLDKRHRRRKRDDIEKKSKGRRTGRSKQRVSSLSPKSDRYNMAADWKEHSSRTPPLSEDDALLQYNAATTSCCCGEDIVEVRINPIPKYDEDYVSLKIEELDEDDDDEYEEEARQRARRKRRRRRRKRRRLKALAVAAVVEDVKVLEPDDLPQRARWTIVATACLLLFMCLMLVGVTLRMAPLIDDMVRKENEELMNSLQREPSVVAPPPAPPPSHRQDMTIAP